MNAVVRPATPPPVPLSGFAFAIRLAKTVVLASVLFLIGNYAINLLLSQVSKEPVREHLREAFNSGTLDLVGSRELDSGLGVHQLNDCLIYDMAARDAGENWLYYLVAAQNTAEQSLDPPERCEQLRNWVLNDPSVTSKEYWYQRYIHGYRAVAIVLVSVLSVADARLVMKLSSYGVFVTLCLVNLLALRTRLAVPNAARKSLASSLFEANELLYVAIGLCFMLFFGLPYFGQSISHAPAIVTLGLFLIFWSIRDLKGQLDLHRMTRLVIVYALFTACFEFLTGYIPVGSVLLCLLVAISDRATRFDDPRGLIFRIVMVEFAFVASIFVVLLLHLFATAVFSPEEGTLQGFFAKLAIRAGQSVGGATDQTGALVGATALGISDVAAVFLKQIPHIGVPSQRAGFASLVIAASIVLIGLGETWLSSATRDAKWRATLIAIALVPLALWILVFLNHSFVHARFMVRILVAIYLTAAVMLIWWLGNRPRTSGLPVTSTPPAKPLAAS